MNNKLDKEVWSAISREITAQLDLELIAKLHGFDSVDKYLEYK